MDKKLVEELNNRLNRIDTPINFMEVCGTHTMEISKLGLKEFLKGKVKLISGPGCPVCVTPSMYIDYIYALAVYKGISIITYGDMLRVPGSNPNISLEKARALGGDIRIVYSSIDSIEISKKNKEKKILFVAIGFETTMPSTCILVEEIIRNEIENLYILSLHKKVEPVMKKILEDEELKLDGFLCPGNVAVIIGEDGFDFIKEEGQIGVIAGFKDDEIISSLIKLIDLARGSEVKVINNYKSFVSKEGNLIAKKKIQKYFDVEGSIWRGLGNIDNSGYRLRDRYKDIDIKVVYPLKECVGLIKVAEIKYICRCGEILRGKISPNECESFGKVCSPSFPIGPCMVSAEGTCSAYYKYQGR